MFGALEALKGVDCLIAVGERHAEVGPEDGRSLVDLLRSLEVVVRLGEFLLLVRDVAQAPPRVVVRGVGLQRSLVALLAAVVVLVRHELVAAQSVRVREVLVQLDGAPEELDRGLVLSLQTVAVAHHAPCLRSEERLLEGLVAQKDERVLVLEVPETGRVVLEALQAIGLDLAHLLVELDCVVVARLLVDALGHLREHPARLSLLVRQLSAVERLGLATVELALQLVGSAHYAEQVHQSVALAVRNVLLAPSRRVGSQRLLGA